VPKKVLVIYEDADLLCAFKDVLEASGYNVLTARDGRTGLYLAVTERPDLVILEINLPTLHGYEVIEQMRLHHPDTQRIPIILILAKKSMREIFDIFSRITILPTPFGTEDLVRCASYVLQISSQEAALVPSGLRRDEASAGSKISQDAPAKNIMVAGVEEFLLFRIKVAIESFGHKALLVFKDDEIIPISATFHPQSVFVQYWNPAERFDAIKILGQCSRSPEMKGVSMTLLEPHVLDWDEYLAISKYAYILSYSDPEELVERVGRLYK
jgi:DNA-binding response OmpR family regulator